MGIGLKQRNSSKFRHKGTFLKIKHLICICYSLLFFNFIWFKQWISGYGVCIFQNSLRSTVEHAIFRFQIVSENDNNHVEHV